MGGKKSMKTRARRDPDAWDIVAFDTMQYMISEVTASSGIWRHCDCMLIGLTSDVYANLKK